MGDFDSRIRSVWDALLASSSSSSSVSSPTPETSPQQPSQPTHRTPRSLELDAWCSLLARTGVDVDTATDLFNTIDHSLGWSGLGEFFAPYPILLDACVHEVGLMSADRIAQRKRGEAERAVAKYSEAVAKTAQKLSIIPEADEQLMQAIVKEQTSRAALTPLAVAVDTPNAPCSAAHDHSGSLADEAAFIAFGDRLRTLWNQKEGTILDELQQNLKAPSPGVKLPRLSAAATALEDSLSEEYAAKQNSPIALLCLHLYSLASQDVDSLMGFPGVPSYNAKDTTEWNAYRSKNAVIFRSINWALRTAPDREDSWNTISQWIKYIVLLMAVSSQPLSDSEKTPLSRGLAALPASVLLEHQNLKEGDPLYWPAPSSCATEKQVSVDYIEGNAANATTTKGSDTGSILFTINSTHCGAPLTELSKYPGESEILLPPLSKLRVTSVEKIASKGDYTAVTLRWDSALATTHLKDLCDQALQEARTESEKFSASEGIETVHASRVHIVQQRCVAHKNAEVIAVQAKRGLERLTRRLKDSTREVTTAETRLDELKQMVEAQEAEVQSLQHIVAETNHSITIATETLHTADREVTEKGREEVLSRQRAQGIAEEALIARQRAEGVLEASVGEVKLMKSRAGKAKLDYRDACDAEEKARREQGRTEAGVVKAERVCEELSGEGGATQPADRAELIAQEIRVCEQRNTLRRNEEQHRSAIRLLQEQRGSHRSPRKGETPLPSHP